MSPYWKKVTRQNLASSTENSTYLTYEYSVTNSFMSQLTLSPLGPGMPAAPLSPGMPCRPGGPWAPAEPAGPMAPYYGGYINGDWLAQ